MIEKGGFVRFLDDHTHPILGRWKIIKLHSSLRQEAEKQIFAPARPGYRKIILSTNVAESSITITDVRYIFDFGLTKRTVVDKDSSFSFLRLEWCSQAEVQQRTGRSGRVQKGKVREMKYLF